MVVKEMLMDIICSLLLFYEAISNQASHNPHSFKEIKNLLQNRSNRTDVWWFFSFFFEGTVEVYSALRDPLPETSDDKKYDPFSGFISKPAAPNAGRSISYLPKSGQVVRALPAWKVPKTIVSEGATWHLSCLFVYNNVFI